MLTSLFVNLAQIVFIAIGKLLMRLSLGKAGWQAAETLEKEYNGTSLLWTLGLFLWIISILSWSSSIVVAATPYFIAWAILYPIIYVLWWVYARKVYVPKIVAKARAVYESSEEYALERQLNNEILTAQTAKSNSWTCTCGRTNTMFVSSCVCGLTKREAKQNNTMQQ